MFTELTNYMGIYRGFADIENRVFCMDFNPIDTERFPKELIDYAYNREVYYMKRLNNYNWSPELLDTNDTERKVYFKWYNNTCEDKLPSNFYNQLLQITKDLHNEQIYKPSFYQKFFYNDDNDIMRTFSWYTSSNYDEQPLTVDFFKPILNGDRLQLIENLAVDGKLDMKILIERGFNDYIKWPGNVLQDIYKEVYA